MIRVSNIKRFPWEKKELLWEKAAKKLGIPPEEITNFSIVKESLDARKKSDIHFIYTVDVSVKEEKPYWKKNKDISPTPKEQYRLPDVGFFMKTRPVVVGFGPGGMFAALLLASLGLRPIVLERGKQVEERMADVEDFWRTGVLNTESNVQFGEGGAGTFSDGKLTARMKDIRCRKVLEEFVAAGAPEEILYSYQPHIGTDKLRDVVRRIREKIIDLGGEVRFQSKMTDILLENGSVKGVVVNSQEIISTDTLLLAVGHSARDTFQKLYERNVPLSPKPFAVGVRIEHPQALISRAQWKDMWDCEALGAAEYKLTYQAKDGRGVYTFCMCPGGRVVAAASEEGMTVTNGMSEYARKEENANSALLVQVTPEDFPSTHPLAGIAFQRDLEKKAFLAAGGGYLAPAQYVGDLLGRDGWRETETVLVNPSYQPGVVMSDFHQILPYSIVKDIKEALPAMGQKMEGFDMSGAILTGVETRSSSPVRVDRDRETGQSIGIKGLFPVGEGAGYAGGIVSSAVDGIRAAEKAVDKKRIL